MIESTKHQGPEPKKGREISLYYGPRYLYEQFMFEKIYQTFPKDIAFKLSWAFGFALRSEESQERVLAIQNAAKRKVVYAPVTALGSTGNGIAITNSDIEVAILDPTGTVPREFERSELNDVLDEAAEHFLTSERQILRDGPVNEQGWTMEPDTSTFINQATIRKALKEDRNFLLIAAAFSYPVYGNLEHLQLLREALVRRANKSSIAHKKFDEGMQHLMQGRLKHRERFITLLTLAQQALQEGKQPTIDPVLAELLQNEHIDDVKKKLFSDSAKADTPTLKEISFLYPSKQKFDYIEDYEN